MTKISGPWGKKEKIVQVAAGHTFALFLTESGNVYAAGSCEHGQLGNGTTGERIVKGNKIAWDVQSPPSMCPLPCGWTPADVWQTEQVLGLLEDKKIVQVAAGTGHSLALDEDGHVYAWGYAGYCRLGLGTQKDELVPALVAQFSDSNEKKRAREVYCGPTSKLLPFDI